jgi:SPP1 gp7 family putative phage head morphogenesis protein
MPNYWEERQVQKYLAGEKLVNEYYKGLIKSFEQAKKEIRSVINDFYFRYAAGNELTFEMAQKCLNKTELGELQEFIDLVNKHMGEYNQKLVNMSIRARITRYQALEMQIDAILQQLYAIEYRYKGEELLKDIYSDAYYRTWFNIDQYHGFHAEFAQINPATVEELINYPFNGANFSTRLWKQKDHLTQTLSESITTMLIQGKSPKALASEFAKKFNTKKYEAYRLLQTEGAFMVEQGTLAAYKEDGVDKYQILATLDMKTSEICRDEDSKIYNVDEAVTGVNYPPYHPFCRTTTVPYYEDAEPGTRAARDAEGNNITVPADMTYEQWKNKYIDQPDSQIRQEILSNPHRLENYSNQQYNKHKEGTKQYEQYKQERLKKGRTEQSSLLISYEEGIEIVKKYAGTGVFSRNRQGVWRKEEFVDTDSIIGIVRNIDGTETQTNRIQIKYGENNVHIVPVLPRKEGK